MTKIFFILMLISFETRAERRICDVFKLIACPDAFSASRGTTGGSMPSNASAASINPASMSTDKGFGVEAIKYDIWYDVNFITGTGAVGSAFSVANNDGTFFGSLPLETEAEYVGRHATRKKYKSDKFTGMLAFNIFGNKKKKSKFKMNVGVIGKYNDLTSRFSSGVGASIALGLLSFGVARNSDDHVDLQDESKKFYTNTFTMGFKLVNVALDWSYIKNLSDPYSRIRILSSTFFAKKFMLTFGHRQQEFYFLDDPTSQTVRTKEDIFLGFQYSVYKKVLAGIFYNYYLYNELSLGLSFFI